jgi:Domain of unknown function (DUF4861)
MKDFRVGAASAGLLLISAAASAAGVSITVNNDLDVARPHAIIAVPFRDIAAIAPELRMYHVIVRDPRGRALPAQITNYQHDHHGAVYDDLVFSYDFAAGEKRALFTLEPSATATPPDPPCVYARPIPERFDDMAWENDRIAHRMYGATLNSPVAEAVGERLRGSGIDVWGKRVTYPIVDRWYAKGHDQFHADGEGEGLDLYSIGGSRGDGGTGLWDGAKLWASDNFANAQVLANGPRRAVFRLTYAPWDAGGAGKIAETKQFTVDCGVNFDAVESTFDLASDEAVIAIGLTEHPAAKGFPDGVLTCDPQGRWMSLWEEDQNGGLGTAVILGSAAQAAGFAHEAPAKMPGYGNHLLLVKARDGAPVRYFIGAGWNRSGQFSDRAAWETQVKAFAAAASKPLTISVSARP